MSNLSKLVAPVLASVLLIGCGSGSSKPGGGGGAGGSTSGTFNPSNLACTGSTSQTANCTTAELEPFQTCITTSCATGLQTCYGSGFMTGQFSGPCGTYAACVGKCSCSDNACRTACGAQPTECSSCLSSSLTTCAFSCLTQLPACATGGGLGGSSGGLGGSSGGLGGASGTTTCLAQLAICCAGAASTALQAACAAEAQDLVSMGTVAETACGVKLAGLKATYCP